jgi:pimeloyl-ACP methyl ester carboxylesterase
MWPLKSTIVRSIIQGQWQAAALISKLEPAWGGQMAVELALRTRRSSRPVSVGFCERPHYQEKLSVQGHKVAVYRWVGRGPRVLVSHGWNSSALRLYPLIEALRQAGYEVVAFDHIGHGESSGQSASLARFARVIQAMDQHYGPFYGAVGHSMGAAGLALARHQSGSSLPLVLLAPPADVRRWFAQVAEKLGFSRIAYEKMERFLERREHIDLDSTPPEVTMPGQTAPSLLLIGQKDREVSPEESRRYELGPVRRLEFEGLDHKTLCSDAQVLKNMLDFLHGSPATTG